MANRTLQERLAGQVSNLNFGDLNSVSISEFKPKIDHDTDVLRASRDNIVRSLKDNILLEVGQIKAVVLYAWHEEVVLHGNEKKQVVHVIARIPELDMVPPPRSLPIDNNPNDTVDWVSIKAHDTFLLGLKYQI